MSHQLFEKLRGNTFQIVSWKQHYNYMNDYYDINKEMNSPTNSNKLKANSSPLTPPDQKTAGWQTEFTLTLIKRLMPHSWPTESIR